MVALALFGLTCALFFAGFLPARLLLQTLRQESVAPEARPRIES